MRPLLLPPLLAHYITHCLTLCLLFFLLDAPVFIKPIEEAILIIFFLLPPPPPRELYYTRCPRPPPPGMIGKRGWDSARPVVELPKMTGECLHIAWRYSLSHSLIAAPHLISFAFFSYPYLPSLFLLISRSLPLSVHISLSIFHCLTLSRSLFLPFSPSFSLSLSYLFLHLSLHHRCISNVRPLCGSVSSFVKSIN